MEAGGEPSLVSHRSWEEVSERRFQQVCADAIPSQESLCYINNNNKGYGEEMAKSEKYLPCQCEELNFTPEFIFLKKGKKYRHGCT